MGVKILVADDHALIREAFRHLLAELEPGVAVLEAGDCDSACRLIEQNPDLDLVLLDLRLPGAGGLATLRKLRDEQPALPVVVVSALEDAGTVRAALAQGAMGFIPKSSPNDVMMSALRLVLSGGRYLPPEILSADGAAPSPPASLDDLRLTDRQREVLALMIQGKSNKLICRELGLAEATVKIHVTAILRALKVSSRAQAIVAVQQLGITPIELAPASPAAKPGL
jgi:DNA-binding NarL/FixJ family response regulator